jgi:hypothetical protein
MEAVMNSFLGRYAGLRLLILALGLLVVTEGAAQGTTGFAKKGVVEVGGNISFSSISRVSDGETGSAMTLLNFAPFVGYFITDGFELGVNPFSITSASYGGSSATEVMIFLAPSYNFEAKGNAYPFIEALLGYTSSSNGETRSGFSYGARGGVKLAVTGKGLLNLGLQYVMITQNRSGETERNGSNNFSISAGFTVWF